MKTALYVAELDIKGGTHKQVLRLAQHLIEQGHDVEVLTPRYVAHATYEEFRDIPVTAIWRQEQSSSGVFTRILSKLAPVRLAFGMDAVDVLNVHDNRGVLFYATARLLRKSRCNIWQINDLHPAFRVGPSNTVNLPAWKRTLHILFNRWMAARVDAVTVNVGKNTERVKQQLGVDAHLFHCGVDLPRHPTEPLAPQGAPYRVLSTGTFVPYRNYETLIDGCVEAQRFLGQPIELTIVGDTRYSPKYVESLRRQALENRVALRIRENLDQDELDSEIARNHVFAFVNIDQSWGLAVFEAAARGKPVVLSRSVGASELVSDCTGFKMVDPKAAIDISQAIVGLLRDPVACIQSAREAQQYTKTMSWERLYCSPVESMFRKLLNDEASAS